MYNDGDERGSLFLSENPTLVEAEFEDGTNVPIGTNFILRQSASSNSIWLSKHSALPGWDRRLERVLGQLVSLREVALPIAAVCEQTRLPGFGGNGHPTELRYHRNICSGCGSSFELAQLLDCDSQTPLIGEFPFLDATGDPIVFSNGEPVGIRMGMSRRITLYEPPRKVADDRQMLSARLSEQLEEAGRIVLMLPADALRAIWNHHGGVLALPDTPEYCWIDAIFESQFARRGSRKPLARSVYNGSGHSSLVLRGEGLFPRTPLFRMPGNDPLSHRFPTEAGNPFSWCALVDDLAAGSVELIDWLIDGAWKKEASAVPATKPLRFFLSYAHEDEKFVDRLKTELRPFERTGELELWYDRELIAGMNLDSVIDEKVDGADVFIFMLSSHFLASDYCTGRELRRALERASLGDACVIGIHARPCNWSDVFPSNLLLLPLDGKAITKWRPRDDAWQSIASELKRAIEFLQTSPKPWTRMAP